ncbi:MAG: FAD-binding oxidoreductase [Alphaproteobacteria bacterium]
MNTTVLAPDFKATPFWWDSAPPPEAPETPLPASTDVAIVGSGYTGIAAALTLARGGRSVQVLEAEVPGYGASTRNAGFVGCQMWSKFAPLVERVGLTRAAALSNEAVAAHRYVVELIEREQIACQFTYSGRFIAAHSPTSYESLGREVELLKRHAKLDCDLVPRARQREEMATDFFHGGMIIRLSGHLHPGQYYRGLFERARSAGATIHAKTPVTRLVREPDGQFTLSTPRGIIKAREVIVATNGYTGGLLPWLRRRIITVHTGIAVSEPLGQERVREILPTLRTMIDTRMNPISIRPMPGGDRLQFTAARGLFIPDPAIKAAEILDEVKRALPQLSDIRMEYCWTGQMGFTFDKLPHIGQRDGIRYAMGYCGTGLPMATWLGRKLALRILGDGDAMTALDDRPFPTRVFYRGNPWFLPAVVRWYGYKDRRDLRRAAR